MNSNSPITVHGLLFNVHSLGTTSQIVGFLFCFSPSPIIFFPFFFDKYYSFFPLKPLLTLLFPAFLPPKPNPNPQNIIAAQIWSRDSKSDFALFTLVLCQNSEG